jgi:hypothetical protein
MDYTIYNNNLLDTKRQSGDAAADDFIRYVFADEGRKKQLQQWMGGKSGTEHLNLLKQTFPEFELICKADQLPSWADRRLMKAGAAFFARHSEIIMSLLGLLSLPYCYTAAHGAMVLYLSELIRKQTSKRLHDTAVFVWEVMDPDAFGIGGNGFEEILKVRMMHAAVRHYTYQSGKWNDAWGIPINQEDMAGTNMSFSLLVIRGLRMMGYHISQVDQSAYMHIWAVIGYFTGLNPDMIPKDSKQAVQLNTIIKKRQFRISEQGQELARSLTDHMIWVQKSKASADDIKGLMRYLLGKEVADMLAINAPELPGYKLKLIKTMNVLKSLRPQGDSRIVYQQGYAAYRRMSTQSMKAKQH